VESKGEQEEQGSPRDDAQPVHARSSAAADARPIASSSRSAPARAHLNTAPDGGTVRDPSG